MNLLELRDVDIANIVTDIALTIQPGERVGIIGESGSGKTLTALAIMRLIDATGSITFKGTDLGSKTEKQMCSIRGKEVAMVFQEPMTALDPLMRVGKQIEEAIRIHDRSLGRDKVDELLTEVELDPALKKRYPHELSGGQRQRVLIAMALAHNPDLLICDEPTTALDVTSQKAVVELILRLAAERNAGLLFISHDLGLVASTCERILVMRAGTIVERGSTQQILENPQHEYTKMLVEASMLPPARESRHFERIIALSEVTKRYGDAIVVNDVSLEVHRGERLGIVGESGSGKTTLLKMLAGLTKPSSGSVLLEGSARTVFQDPRSSLDPRMRVADIIKEAAPKATPADIARALDEVGLDETAMRKHPHQFSGGQRQRISIARALIGGPDVLLADEPVSALDVSVRARVLKLLDRLVDEHQLTLVFVSHDLSVVRSVCDTVAVMRDGVIVERGRVEEVFEHPKHWYTQQLLDAIPRLKRS